MNRWLVLRGTISGGPG